MGIPWSCYPFWLAEQKQKENSKGGGGGSINVFPLWMGFIKTNLVTFFAVSARFYGDRTGFFWHVPLSDWQPSNTRHISLADWLSSNTLHILPSLIGYRTTLLTYSSFIGYLSTLSAYSLSDWLYHNTGDNFPSHWLATQQHYWYILLWDWLPNNTVNIFFALIGNPTTMPLFDWLHNYAGVMFSAGTDCKTTLSTYSSLWLATQQYCRSMPLSDWLHSITGNCFPLSVIGYATTLTTLCPFCI